MKWLIALLVSFQAQAQHAKTMAVFGDSVATGAAANDKLHASITSILGTMWTQIWSSSTKEYLHFPENAFPTILSSGLGVRPENVYNMSVGGKRVEAIQSQMDQLDQVLRKKGAEFPNYFFLSFTANDACHEDIFKLSVADFKAEYRRRWVEGKAGNAGLQRIQSSAPKDRDTTVFVMASLDFPQVLTNPKILQHEVNLHGSTVTCRDFRAGGHNQTVSSQNENSIGSGLVERLQRMCPAVLRTNPTGQDEESKHRLNHLRNIYKAMLEAQAEAVDWINQSNDNPHFRITYLRSSSRASFDERHVANDCFHLSNQGQGFLGLEIWNEILSSNILNPAKLK